MGKTQVWLTEKVNEITGLKSDNKYICNVIAGRKVSVQVRDAINQVLGIRG